MHDGDGDHQAHVRRLIAQHSRTVRVLHCARFVIPCTLTAALTFVALLVVLKSNTLTMSLLGALFASALMAMSLILTRRRDLDALLNHLEKEGHLKVRFGRFKTTPEGLVWSKPEDSLIAPWSAIDTVSDSELYVDINLKSGDVVSIAKHTFDSPQATLEFVKTIRQHTSVTSRNER